MCCWGSEGALYAKVHGQYSDQILKVLALCFSQTITYTSHKRLKIKGNKYQHLQSGHSSIKNQTSKHSCLWQSDQHPHQPLKLPHSPVPRVRNAEGSSGGQETRDSLPLHPRGTLHEQQFRNVGFYCSLYCN